MWLSKNNAMAKTENTGPAMRRIIIPINADYSLTQDTMNNCQILTPVVTRFVLVYHRDGQSEQDLYWALDHLVTFVD